MTFKMVPKTTLKTVWKMTEKVSEKENRREMKVKSETFLKSDTLKTLNKLLKSQINMNFISPYKGRPKNVAGWRGG